MADLIDRQTAIETAIEAADKWDGGYSSEREGITRKFFDKVPAAHPCLQLTCNQLATDTISRRAAIDAMKDMYRAAEKWLRDATDDVTKARAESCMASLVEIKLRIEKIPVVQPDHVADIGKKAEGDCISRQAALDAIMGQPPEPHYPSWYAAQIEKLPAVQPDRDVIDDCLYHIYKNISVHTATGGVITIKHYMQVLYEEIYGEGKRPWWMT